jgi:hypothetical protein
MKLAAAVGLCALAGGLGGCAYDYLQRTDRVAYSAGDAVKANLAAQTIDPSRPTIYSTKGLGKNGVISPEPEAETPAE